MGLGKLGLPTALAIESRGHEVFGADVQDDVARIIRERRIPYREERAQELLERSRIAFLPLLDVVRRAEILFVTVQTPHEACFEGITRLPAERRDFDYTYLRQAMADLSDAVEQVGEDRIIVLVSTVLPGTIRREIRPLLGPHGLLCYNPFFIAMGTTVRDFLEPEIVLFGVDHPRAADTAEAFYRTVHEAPFYRTSIENAELIKVLYNTFISSKIAFANTAMELCHRIDGADVDQVIGALKLCHERVISGRYLAGGMGDGGGCHPRDNIALSHLSRRLDLSYDWFEHVMMQRERQTEWLASLVVEHSRGRPICILGKSFKPESNILTGSPALLLAGILEERGVVVAMWDPYVDPPEARPPERAHCYFVGTRHAEFRDFPFAPGSVVLDPFRYIGPLKGVEVIGIGGETYPPE